MFIAPGCFELIVIAAVACVALFVVLGYLGEKKRREALAQWARENGWSFRPGRDRSIEDRFPHLDCLRQGSNRYAYNFMTRLGEAGSEWSFEYHYEATRRDSEGKKKTTHFYFSVVVVETSRAVSPITIRPEGFLDRVADFFGHNDIDFESSEFSKRFHVRSSDRNWAFRVIDQECMEYLLANARGYTIDVGYSSVAVHDDSVWGISEILDSLQLARRIEGMLPEAAESA